MQPGRLDMLAVTQLNILKDIWERYQMFFLCRPKPGRDVGPSTCVTVATKHSY